MSKLDKLIEELCPDGVEYKSIKEIAVVSGAGVDKKINANEQPIKLLNYMDVYRNNYIDGSLDFMEVTASENKISQCNVLKGDVFITPSSEVLNDIGNAAVITEDLENVVYSYHIMRIRLKEYNFITSKYIGYIFESNYVQTQINRHAEGITRYGLTKTKWESITIPLPPLPIQEEIVHILDNFTELTAELTARKKQYEFYRDELLTFGDEVKLIELKECANISRGVRVVRSQLNDTGLFPVYQNSLTPLGYYSKSNFDADTTFLISAGAAGEIGYSYGNFWAADDCFCFGCHDYLLSRFLYYVLLNKQYYIRSRVRKASIPRLSRSVVEKIQIPIPPLAEQERIVSILDKFDALVNDISIGLPAEIEARQKQYEYYREKLLSFKELDEGA